jgi:hypothetical protein
LKRRLSKVNREEKKTKNAQIAQEKAKQKEKTKKRVGKNRK